MCNDLNLLYDILGLCSRTRPKEKTTAPHVHPFDTPKACTFDRILKANVYVLRVLPMTY